LDGNRFDKLAVSLAAAGSSRRSLLARLAGGGFAAALAALGIGGFSAEDAEAKKKAKSCTKRCNKKAKKKDWSAKKKRACNDKCKNKAGGGGGGGGGGGSSAGFRIVNTSDVGEGCTSSASCNTGFCLDPLGVGGTCQVCDPLLVCGGGDDKRCCIVGAECVNGNCIG
jgi:hypothetical protein